MAKDPLPLQPGDTIGIIGGGQLGRMLAMAAARLGFRVATLDPDPAAPSAQVSNRHIAAAFNDKDALRVLAECASVLTYEFENIPADSLSFLEENNTLHPNGVALEKSQDRLIEKRFLNDLGIDTAPFFEIDTLNDLVNATQELGTASILKTRRFGYDGKGQYRLGEKPSMQECNEAVTAMNNTSAILEGHINFQREISVLVARDIKGIVRSYDPSENLHREGILRTSTVPARIESETEETARQIAETIVAALDYVGVMGVELFVTDNGRLIVNEIAPRVHNSGHWTEAACAISQFEQHIRAIAGLPLADPVRHSDCVMENLIGDDINRLGSLLADPSVLVHLYGKAETRPGRKMGHFTRLVPNT